jgi:hypothetical protein
MQSNKNAKKKQLGKKLGKPETLPKRDPMTAEIYKN